MRTELVARLVRRLVAPLQRRVRLMVSRGVIELVNDTSKLQSVQVSLLADEVHDDVEHFQPYGLTARPLPGAEAVFLSVGGDRSHGVVVVVDDRRYRVTALDAGNVALFTRFGVGVHLDSLLGLVHLGDLVAPAWVARADRVDARIAAIETRLNELITKYNAHVHPELGVTTGPPTPTETALPAFTGGHSGGASTRADVVKAK